MMDYLCLKYFFWGGRALCSYPFMHECLFLILSYALLQYLMKFKRCMFAKNCLSCKKNIFLFCLKIWCKTTYHFLTPSLNIFFNTFHYVLSAHTVFLVPRLGKVCRSLRPGERPVITGPGPSAHSSQVPTSCFLQGVGSETYLFSGPGSGSSSGSRSK